MRAGVRAKIRQAAGTQTMLTIKSKRERAVAALQEAAIALDAADNLARWWSLCLFGSSVHLSLLQDVIKVEPHEHLFRVVPQGGVGKGGGGSRSDSRFRN